MRISSFLSYQEFSQERGEIEEQLEEIIEHVVEKGLLVVVGEFRRSEWSEDMGYVRGMMSSSDFPITLDVVTIWRRGSLSLPCHSLPLVPLTFSPLSLLSCS